MKPELFLIKDILLNNKVTNVLDIWAWKGYASLLCASYGADVDAIDNNSQPEFSFPKLLLDHPKIAFQSVELETFELTKEYELVIMTNVIMFVKRDTLLNHVLPKIRKWMSNWAFLVLNYFLEGDPSMTDNMNRYSPSDFSDFWFSLVKSFDKTIEENHPPKWLHKHEIRFLVLKKD